MANKNSHEMDDQKTQTEISLKNFEQIGKMRDAKKLSKTQENLIPVLRVIEGEKKGEHYILSNKITTFGRDSNCTINIGDPKLSRSHCQFIVDQMGNERQDCFVWVEDLNSRNGVWVNGQKISQKKQINNGDQLKIGSQLFGFYIKFPEEVELENYLYKLATRDSTTGLLSKAFFDSSLEFEFRRSNRYRRPLTLAIMDLDHFKKINDTHGHQMGDLVLTEMGKILNEQLRFEDTAIRFGGEEFAIILPETSLKEASVVIERIRKKIQEHPFMTDKAKPFKVTASFGLAQNAVEIKDIKEFISHADKALYQAKSEGRNRACMANYKLAG